MYRIGIVTQFEAAHRLVGNFGPASRLHGHTYRVELTARGLALGEDGTLCDLGSLRQAADEAVGLLNYRDLDEVEGLRGRNTTAEVVAHYLFQQISPHLRNEGITALEVRVWESPQAFAAYEGDL